MRLSTDLNSSHRLSLGLDDGKGPSHVSSPLNGGLPTDEKTVPKIQDSKRRWNYKGKEK